MASHPLVTIVRDNIGDISSLDMAELLVVLKCEIHGRGNISTANFVARALYCFAQELSGPDVPSDNGATKIGDTGAAA